MEIGNNLAIKNFFISWQTTIAGIVVGVPIIWAYIAAWIDTDPTTIPDFNDLFVGIGLLFGFGLAKDGTVSSEDVKGKEA